VYRPTGDVDVATSWAEPSTIWSDSGASYWRGTGNKKLGDPEIGATQRYRRLEIVV